MSDPKELLQRLLEKPVGPAVRTKPRPTEFTNQLEVNDAAGTASVTLTDKPGVVNEDRAVQYLRDEGMDPSQWTVTGMKKSQWGDPDNLKESCSFTFRRVAQVATAEVDIDSILEAIEKYDVQPPTPREGGHTFIVALGDMQFGKIDGDGVEGTLQRTISCINNAADALAQYRLRFSIDHVHIAWLGDHIEGAVSQGGNNMWRTPLPITEQIRLTRRVMLHAMCLFAPLASRVSLAAVPGNHGEAVRIGGTGITRYDDSLDTESLIAVQDAARLAGDKFAHVEFYVPDTDELTVITECSGTIVLHAHGHKWNRNKAFEWFKGQAFSNPQAAAADLLLAGHLHHEHIEAEGKRLFIQVPSMEAESTWFRHTKGDTGNPGLIVAITRDGRTDVKEVIRATA